jgi:peptidyl-prolyl cis-trans isomerase A (cyclophilin A)
MRNYLGLILAGCLCLAPGFSQQTPPQQPTSAQPERPAGLYMTFETSMGSIACKLDERNAPQTVRKIVGLATGRIGGKPFYNGLIFHRVIPGFMIQGGDPLGNGTGEPKFPGFPFADEFTAQMNFNEPGRLAMANSGQNTNGSQFFITEVPTPHLQPCLDSSGCNRPGIGRVPKGYGHTVFGDCSNLDVVRKIARVRADSNGKPVQKVTITRVIVERVGPAPANAPEAMPSKAPARKAPPKTPAK